MSPGPATSAIAPNEFIANHLAFLGDDVLQKVLHDNAARIYHVD
jgi:predicted TIM-barrel fold metal-dependent hydrolase